jgi:ketosteroid isomerase-like protein
MRPNGFGDRKTPLRVFVVLLAALFVGLSATAAEVLTPEQTVELFHNALRSGDRALALSLLSPDVLVFEMGMIDASRDAYAAKHLQADIEAAGEMRRELLSRRSGGPGDSRWLLSTYRLRTNESDPAPLTVVETIILQRTGTTWHIIHLHWSVTLTMAR